MAQLSTSSGGDDDDETISTSSGGDDDSIKKKIKFLYRNELDETKYQQCDKYIEFRIYAPSDLGLQYQTWYIMKYLQSKYWCSFDKFECTDPANLIFQALVPDYYMKVNILWSKVQYENHHISARNLNVKNIKFKK